MKNNTQNYEGLVIYFQEYTKGTRYGPVKLKSLDDLEEILHEHNNFDEYLIIKKSINGDEPIERGEIEHPITRKRKLK